MKTKKELKEWAEKRQRVLEKKNSLLDEVKADITGLFENNDELLENFKAEALDLFDDVCGEVESYYVVTYKIAEKLEWQGEVVIKLGDCYVWGRKEIREIPFCEDEVFEKIAEKEIEKI